MGERIDDGLSLNEFRELLQVSGLERLDRRFLEYLESRDAALHARLLDYRHANAPLTALQTSELLLALAPLLEVFVARVFGIEPAVADLRARTLTHNEVMAFKQEFVLRRARHYRGAVTQSFAELDDWLSAQIERMGIDASDVELAVARYGRQLLGDPTANAQAIEQLTRWCALALKDPAGRARVASWACFRLPQRTDYARLVPVRKLDGDPVGRLQGDPGHLRRRDGFALTDPRMPPRDIQSEVHYCIYCHDHDGDFCSKGFPAKKGSPELGLLVNPLGVTLTGCPLEEKISEMHVLKRDGMSIAALAMIMVDNPLVPATGHRICNDCMKSCIYQKQDPVDIPQIETAVLTDVLGLPWGVEIYDLLTRWNPLRRRQYLPKPYNGRKVLIVGQGPAGFAMAHYLSMEGCAVVGIDGLKIEPLPEALLTAPVRDYSALVEPLDRRVMAGFGGVAEYGITVRWDKNFLKLIYLSLMRRPTFQAFGGVRLGGTLMIEDAWRLGFDHVCIATGAGLPRVIPMGNSLARGMRQASDFLMALQLTGAAKRDSLANLQVRLPAVVIGGGLTAVDTATEVQAYYIVQVEKTLERYERLIEVRGEQGVRAAMDTESLATLDEFLAHGRAARAERQRAARTGEAPDFTALLRAWGGATIVYRRGMNESPAYTRNHEEVTKALEEGIYYAEGLEPVHAKLDAFGHIQALICRRRVKSQDGRWLTTGEELSLPARSVLVAAGAIPNTIYEHEHSGTLILDGDHFLPHILDQTGLQPVEVATHCKAPEFGPFTSYHKHERRVSFIGDTHPVFHGSVVKAIASAQRSYPQIMAALERLPAPDAAAGDYDGFRARIADALSPRVAQARRLQPGVLELKVRAPMAARNFASGQFFRLQNYEVLAPRVDSGRLQTGPLVLSGAGVSDDTVRLMVLEGSAGARVCATLRPGDPVVLMGPTGAATEIPRNETVLVVGGRWATAAMLTLGPTLRDAGNRVLYIALFRAADELYAREELEAATDAIVWCTAAGEPVSPGRAQDVSVQGDYPDLMRRYAQGALRPQKGQTLIPLQQIDRMLVMGSTRLMRQTRELLRGDLKHHFRPEIAALGTVGTPMQCMLKGVCAQCLNWQIDPATGNRTRAVFACAMQEQPLFWIDLDNVSARAGQSALSDRLNALWLDYLFERGRVSRL